MEAQQVLTSVKILLERFGLDYSVEQLEVMRRKSLAVFHFAVNGLKQFDTSLFKVSRMIKILAIGRRTREPQSKISFITDLEFVHCLSTTISPDLITKASKEHSIAGESSESKLYQLVSAGHLVPLEIGSITSENTFNNCLVMNHEKKLAYFASKIPTMVEEIGNVVIFKGKIPESYSTVRDKLAFIRKKAEDFQREILELSLEYPTSTIVITPPPTLTTITSTEEKVDVFSTDGIENPPVQEENKEKTTKKKKKVNDKEKRKKEKKEKERKKKKEKKEKKRKDKKKSETLEGEGNKKKSIVVDEKKKRKREEEEKPATDPMKEKKEEVMEMEQGKEKIQKIDPPIAAATAISMEIIPEEKPIVAISSVIITEEEKPIVVTTAATAIPMEIIPEEKPIAVKSVIIPVVEEMEISKPAQLNIEEIKQALNKIVLKPETPFEEKTQWFNSYLSQLREVVDVV